LETITSIDTNDNTAPPNEWQLTQLYQLWCKPSSALFNWRSHKQTNANKTKLQQAILSQNRLVWPRTSSSTLTSISLGSGDHHLQTQQTTSWPFRAANFAPKHETPSSIIYFSTKFEIWIVLSLTLRRS
jgi:hypothetical protein